jgi:type IV pilus assembly protein PilE
MDRNHPADNRDMRHTRPYGGSQRGFTLIELMIAVAVVAVLAMIALPSFQDSIRKSRRADAMAGLLRLQQVQERFRGENPAYASAVASMPAGTSSNSPEQHYSLAVDASGAATYRMSATAKSTSPQYADTRCRKLTVEMQTGGTIVTKSFDANDVETTTTARCWVR